MKITKKAVDALESRPAQYVSWDDDLHGFGVRVNPSGSKSFVLQYRNEHGRSRRLTLGRYGPLTVDAARGLAIEALAAATVGRDPAQEKADKRRENTVAELCDRYITDHAELRKKASSIRSDKWLIRDYIKPALGTLSIASVTRADVVRLHHSLRDRPTAANRLLALLSKVFNLAEAWGLRAEGTNPTRHIQKNTEKPRRRYLTGEELSRLGAALTEAEQKGTEHPSVILCLRLLLTTGCRLGEIMTLKWSYVDFASGVINLPDSKTGAKTIPIPGPAADLLLSAGRLQGNDYVCHGLRPGSHIVGVAKPWYRIRKAAGIDDVRLHDLRHGYASVAAAEGLGLPLIGALLGHTQPATTARYSHLAMDPLKAAAELIAGKIQEHMNKKPAKKVVPFPGRK